jgi:uncharacterized protein (DUF1919 family)
MGPISFNELFANYRDLQKNLQRIQTFTHIPFKNRKILEMRPIILSKRLQLIPPLQKVV